MLLDLTFGPFEWGSLWIVDLNKALDGILQLANRDKTGGPERLSGKDAKPDFHLVEPRGMCRCKMEMDIGMLSQPPIVLWFMGIEVVENDVKFLFGVHGDDVVHEIEELPASSSLVGARSDPSSGCLQSGK